MCLIKGKDFKIKLLYIILLLLTALHAADTVAVTEKPQASLEAISKYAIRFGHGSSSNIYVFVDPMCKYSRNIIKKINENKMLQVENSYFVFLYRLQKFNSDELIQYIYQSNDKKSTLIDVMVDEEIIEIGDFKANEETLNALLEISQVAKKLDMKLRPYMISFDMGSKFCRVSEGNASCLEEFE